MAKTAGSVLTDVRDHLDESSDGYWVDAEVYRKIDQATRELYLHVLKSKKRFFLRSETVTFIAGTADYAMTAEIYDIQSIRATTSGKGSIVFEPLNANSPRFIEGLNPDVSVVDPILYYYDVLKDRTLRFSPTPRVVMAVNVDYTGALPAITGSSGVFADFPDAWLLFIEFRAADILLHKQPGYKGKWGVMAGQVLGTIMAVSETRAVQGPELVVGFGED